ncbi:MAG: hypothetical protein RR740_00285 [Pseudomonas sp.]
MAFITLIDPQGHTRQTGKKTHTTDVEWKFVNTVNRSHETGVARHSTGESNASVYESSFIQLRHPDGKVWDSMFVSLTRDGSTGLMISRWGKDHFVKGQSQVKVVSERTWSDTVRDKFQKGGYNCAGFIGRETPIDAKFSFMKDLHDDPTIATLPQIGFNQSHAEEIRINGTESAIGKMLGQAIGNIFPTAKFFEHAAWNGHDLIGEIKKAVSVLDRGPNDAGASFLLGLGEMLGQPIDVTISSAPPEPQIDREEVYGGGWGGFA